MENKDLKKYRKKIDSIDKIICKKLMERFILVKSIAEYKKTNNLKISDIKRENEILKKIEDDYINDSNVDLKIIEDIKKIYKYIFKISKQNQK